MTVWFVYNLTTNEYVARPNGEPYTSFKKSDASRYMLRTLKQRADCTELTLKGYGFDEAT